MSVKTYKKGTKKKLTAHFNLSEMHCHGNGCCSVTKIDTDIVKLAEKIRVMLGEKVTVTSAYRCSKHNVAVGGANGSGHCYGTAMDIVMNGFSNLQIAIAAELNGCPRIGIYDGSPNMAHIGTGNKCHWHNTGNYLPKSHSFIPVPYAKPKLIVNAKSANKYIAYLQACLYAKDYKGKNGKLIKIDGDWGANTTYAVNQYRKNKGWKSADYLKTVGINGLLK